MKHALLQENAQACTKKVLTSKEHPKSSALQSSASLQKDWLHTRNDPSVSQGQACLEEDELQRPWHKRARGNGMAQTSTCAQAAGRMPLSTSARLQSSRPRQPLSAWAQQLPQDLIQGRLLGLWLNVVLGYKAGRKG